MVKTVETREPRGGLKEWWMLARLRFWVGTGNAGRAMEFLRRVPLPNAAKDAAAFEKAEQEIWQKYVDRQGNLVPITWKRLLLYVLPALLLLLAAGAMVIFWPRMKAFFRESQLAKAQSQVDATPKFLLTSGDTARVDTRFNPKVERGHLSLPAVSKTKAGADSVSYLPATRFKGDTIALGDRAWARSFVRVNRDTLYFIQPLNSKEPGGWVSPRVLRTWLSLTSTKQAETSSTAGNLPTLEITVARKLRKEPDPNADPVWDTPIPVGAKVQAVAFSPEVGGFVWYEIVYTDATQKKTYQGWIAAYSVTVKASFIKIAQ